MRTAVRLPRQVADEVVRVVPARRVYTLDELLAGITPDNIPESFDDGPKGRERP